MRRKPKSGDKVTRDSIIFSAAAIAGWEDAAEDYRRRRIADNQRPRDAATSLSQVKIRNDSGADRDAGDALELGEHLYTTMERRGLAFAADLRAASGCYGVLVEPIRDGDIGWAQLAGVVIASVDIQNANHTHAYLPVSNDTLKSNFGGTCKILHKPSGTGVKTCVVALGDAEYFRKAKLDADLTAGSSAAASIYVAGSDLGSETVYFNWMEAGTTSIPSMTEILVKWFDDEQKWVVIQQECAG